jgi:hypothetical protein
VQAYSQGLHQCGKTIIKSNGKHKALVCADQGELCESSIGWRLCAGASQHDYSLAQIGSACFAERAETAGTSRVNRYLLADLYCIDAISYCYNLGGEFVSENKGAVRNETSAIAVLKIMEIGAAYADSPIANENHASFEHRFIALLDSYVSCAVQNSSFHAHTVSFSERWPIL